MAEGTLKKRIERFALKVNNNKPYKCAKCLALICGDYLIHLQYSFIFFSSGCFWFYLIMLKIVATNTVIGVIWRNKEVQMYLI